MGSFYLLLTRTVITLTFILTDVMFDPIPALKICLGESNNDTFYINLKRSGHIEKKTFTPVFMIKPKEFETVTFLLI